VYQVNKLLYLTDNDPALRKRMKEEPEKVLSEFKLTAEEHAALTSGAVGKLYQMGRVSTPRRTSMQRAPRLST